MKKLLFIPLILILGLAVFAQTQNSYKAEVSVYFSPKGECQDAIIKQINSAEKSIYVAMYYFTNQKLADELIKSSKKKGMTIKVLLDKEQETDKYAKEFQDKYAKGKFPENNISVEYYSPPKNKGQDYNGKMHHKFAVIDKKIVITGSYNWTGAAETSNNENLLIIKSLDIAKEYIEEWDTLSDDQPGKQEKDIISWQDASKYIGQIKTVEGKIVRTYNSDKACFLNFHTDYNANHFYLVIFPGDYTKFSEAPEKLYRDKKIRVKGEIKEFKGKTQIIVKEPEQIEIVK